VTDSEPERVVVVSRGAQRMRQHHTSMTLLCVLMLMTGGVGLALTRFWKDCGRPARSQDGGPAVEPLRGATSRSGGGVKLGAL